MPLMNSSTAATQSAHATTTTPLARRQGSTTIKVPVELRDRLKQDAAAHRQTLAERIDSLLRESARYSRMANLRRAIDATPPQVMADYIRERDEWLDAKLG